MALRDPMPIEEERALFFHELGIAMAAWAIAESGIFHILMHCVPSEARAVTGVAFARLTGLSPKLQFVNGAMERIFGEGSPGYAEWGIVLQDIRDESGKRNNLAHWVPEVYEAAPVGKRVVLRHWVVNKGGGRRQGMPPDGALSIHEIVSYRASFVALGLRLTNYEDRLLQRKERAPKSGEQPQNPPPIRTLRLQMHAALGHQHESSIERRRREDADNAAKSLEIPMPPNEDIEDAEQIEAGTRSESAANAGEPSATADAGNAAQHASPNTAPEEEGREAP